MRPLDPRLLRYAQRARAPIAGVAVLGVITAGLVIVQAQLLAVGIADAFLHGATLASSRGTLIALVLVVAARAVVAWASEAVSYQASGAVKAGLRRELLARVADLGPRWLANGGGRGDGRETATLTVLATDGIEALDGYFGKYLPQLVLGAVVPIAVVVRVGVADPLAGLTILGTLPLVPLFGALVGRAAGGYAERRWRTLGVLSHHFLDVVSGLPTLKVFGRAGAQRAAIGKVTDDYRRATLGTLRLAFLSGLVLELIATVSVALVAVGVGLSLVYGHLDLRTGLLALILAPEAYLPLRQAAAQFHATADGLAAANQVLAVLEAKSPTDKATPPPNKTVLDFRSVKEIPHYCPEDPSQAGNPSHETIRPYRDISGNVGREFVAVDAVAADAVAADAVVVDAVVVDAVVVDAVSVRHPGRVGAAPDRVSLTIRPGEITVLCGPSGCGKSSLIDVLLGFVQPSSGHVVVCPSGPSTGDAAGLCTAEWLRDHVGWVGQEPYLFPGTVASNIRLGWRDAPDEAVVAAARAAALDDVPLDRPVTERTGGLSAGQRRRVALARALLPGRPVLLLDEPTAGLDPDAEDRVLDSLRREAATGRAILIAAHHPRVIAIADRVVTMGITDTTGAVAAADATDVVDTMGAAATAGVATATDGTNAATTRRRDHRRDGGGEHLRGGDGVSEPKGAAVPGMPRRAESRAGARKEDAASKRLEVSEQGGAVRRLVIAGLAGILSAGSAIGLLAMSGWLISRSALRPPVLYLMVPVAAVQAFGLGRAGFRYAERLAGHDAALRLLAGLRTSAYERLERLAPAGLAAFRSGDLMRRLVGDIDSLTDRWLRVRLPYAVAACTGAGAVALESTLLPPAGAVLAGSLIGAAIAAPLLAGSIARRAERRLAPLRGELAAATVDVISGAGELAVYGGTDTALRAVNEANDQVAYCEARSAYARGVGAAVCVLAAGAAVWASLAFGVQASRDGRLAGVLLAVVVLLPLAVHEVFGGLAPAAQEIPRVRSAAARVREVMEYPDPVREPDRPAALPEGPYHVAVRGLVARWRTCWPGGPDRAVGPPGLDVLCGVDFDLPAGSRTAVIGPSGAGKTTLAMVLLRFLDPVAGSVTLNGTDLTALDGEQVRTVIGLCAQDAHIFDTTLRENLRLARRDATDADLLGVLGQARLAEWVTGLPDGLDTPVGEHGARLSGGQRQRLALARVLLAGFPVVVFDEPAEHLDEQTAEALTRDLLAATPGRTVVLITHRSIEGLGIDQVIRLRDGQATVDPSMCISAGHRGTVPP